MKTQPSINSSHRINVLRNSYRCVVLEKRKKSTSRVRCSVEQHGLCHDFRISIGTPVN